MPVTIEGFTPEELLALPQEQLDVLVFTGEPVSFRVGSAEVLGQFRCDESRLVMELAQIEGGGEGVLPALWAVARQYAVQRELVQVEWLVHAIACANPNPKLRRVMERRGFTIQDVAGVGPVYRYVDPV